jgi:hypothetical protein
MTEIEALFEAEDLYANFTDAYDYDQLNGEHQEFNYIVLLYLTITPISCVIGFTGNCLGEF